MRATTSSLHSPPTLLLFMLVLIITATTSTTANNGGNNNEEQDGQQPDINLSMVDIRNDLPPSAPRLYVVGTFQSSEARIDPGTSYTFVAGGKKETGFLIWDQLCASLVVFDPDVDLGHHQIFWSAREYGIYHSYDEAKWENRASWQPADKCQ